MGNCYVCSSTRSTFFDDKDMNDKDNKRNTSIQSKKSTNVSRFRTVSEFNRARRVEKDPPSATRGQFSAAQKHTSSPAHHLSAL